MSLSYVKFELQDGYITNWLSAGPQAIPLNEQKDYADPDVMLETAHQYYDEKSGIIATPVERGPLSKGLFNIGDYEGSWSYYRCLEDRFVDHSAVLPTHQFLRSWAYAQVTSPKTQMVEFSITTYGPVDVWVNKKNVFHSERFSKQSMAAKFEAEVASGKNQILVRFGGIAAPACTLAIALRLNPANLSVLIPSLIPSISRRNHLEAINEMVYLDRDVYMMNDHIRLNWPRNNWPEEMGGFSYHDVRLQTPSGRIYSQAENIGKPGDVNTMSASASIPEGPFQVLLMPRSWEYYEKDIRITKTLELWSMGINRYSDAPYGTYEERRREALVRASRYENNLFAEVAKAALNQWSELDVRALEQAIQAVERGEDGSEQKLLGLLGMQARFGKQEGFPKHIQEQIKSCAVHFNYGDEVVDGCFDLQAHEGRQLVFLACQVLAGQLYPGSTFEKENLTGRQLRKKAETQTLAWMQQRSANGFTNWDSRLDYAHTLTALSYLVDLAKSEAIWELGSVFMDKLLFTMALNSFKGVFGSTQGYASNASIKSGLLEETSGISRLLWGMGIYNHHIAAPVSLACMEEYTLTPIIAQIASGLPDEIWNREQQAGADHRVNKVTYRTPDYMLCSAQDYRPGEPGQQEHIWQASLGPRSVVFVNHPGCSSEKDAHTPGFWVGNAVLPRVAQWKDTLVAVYNLPEDAWMSFTHAYLPTSEFDEYAIEGNTIFARKGDGYLALTASSGLEMVETGRTAFRELRSYGNQSIWVCQMGRAAVDGDFAAFQNRVKSSKITFDRLSVACATARGETLAFGWERPLLVNGEAQPLSGFKHFENPYTIADLPCEEMEVKTEDYLLRLNFGDL